MLYRYKVTIRCQKGDCSEFSTGVTIVHNFVCTVMLILASQRIESLIGNWMGHDFLAENEPTPTKRGAAPTIVEW